MVNSNAYTPLSRVPCEQDGTLPDDDATPLYEGTTLPIQASTIGRTRKLIFGAIVAMCCLLGPAANNFYGGCIPDDSIMGLPDFESKVELNIVNHSEDGFSHNVVAHWLKMADDIRNEGFTSVDQENELIQDAMKSLENISVDESRDIVKTILDNSADKSKERRDELKKFAESFAANMTASRKTSPFGTSPGMKSADAYCTFDILSILSYWAAAGSDINDAVRTCERVTPKEFFRGTHVHDKTCGFNVLTAVGNLAGSGALVSAASQNCAETLLLKSDSICATSMIGLIGSLARLAGSISITNAACHPWRSWYGRIDPDLRPSEIGSNWVTRERGETYVADLNPIRFVNGQIRIGTRRRPRLGAEPSQQEGAEPPQEEPDSRRLLLGGGKASILTQCIVDAVQISWGVAYFALHVNGLANKQAGQSCPARNLAGDPRGYKDILWQTLAAYCTVDIFAMLNYITQVVAYTAWSFIHCADYLNLKALCTVGINGIVASLTGLGLSAAGVQVACDYYKHYPANAILDVGHAIDKWSKGSISYWYGNGMGGTNLAPLKYIAPYGRRLRNTSSTAKEGPGERPPPEMEEAMKKLYENYRTVQEGINDLRSRFSVPEEAFASIGINISDPNAAWRKKSQPHLSLKDLIKLTEKRPQDAKSKGIFEQPTCKK